MEDLKHEIKDTKGCGKRCHASRLASKTPRSSGLTSHAQWPKVKLGDMLRLFHGKAIQANETGCYPVYGSNGEIGRCDSGLYNNAIIIGRVGAYCGSVAREKCTFWASDNTIVCRAVDDVADTDFCYYLLKDLRLNNYAGGTAQPLITQGIIKQIQIPLPPLPVQRKIADVLSAYDDLIENNRRRIAILEETARLTYRKWFGMVEEGKATTLGDVLEVIESGSRPRGGAVNDGVPSIGAEKIESIGIYDYSSEKYVSREYYDKMRRGKIRSGDVLLYKDGAYTGKVSMALNGFPHVEAAVNEHVFILRTRNLHAQYFLYCFLRQQEIYERINTIASAKACQPGLNQSDVLNLEIELPTGDEIGRFEDKVISFFDEIINLAKQNAALAAARDMLLPRLMKGEVNL